LTSNHLQRKLDSTEETQRDEKLAIANIIFKFNKDVVQRSVPVKRIGLFVISGLVLGLVASTSANANSLIVNGSFENPSVGGGWSLFGNGQVPGWYTTDGAGLIEIDNSNVVGGPAYSGTQSLEVNSNYPEAVDQLVTGLVVGQTYDLSFAYGDRPGSGDQQMQVWFGGSLVTLDSDNLNPSSLLWLPQTFVVTASSTSEVLSFVGLPDSGLTSYGNEVDGVSLDETPEPSSLILLGTGLGLAAFAFAFRRQRILPGALAA
jgi:hypothetical protein